MVRNRKELSVDVKEAIVSLYYSGIRQAEISGRLSIPRTTITGVMIDSGKGEMLRTFKDWVHQQN